ncbi:MAG: hypothetical protein AB199_03820 [Parcubacteria bacterium C7867-004]|nr:MAG: hypothetical protein AB199_03820 [Parcubacteria bacterium C7867-004]
MTKIELYWGLRRLSDWFLIDGAVYIGISVACSLLVVPPEITWAFGSGGRACVFLALYVRFATYLMRRLFGNPPN